MNRSILRGITILETLARAGRPLALKELAAAAGLNKMTVYRLMISLEAKGLVHKLSGNGLITLGPAFLFFAEAFRRNGVIKEKVLPFIQALVDSSQETVGYTERYRADMCVTLERWESPQETRTVSQTGIPRPLYAGSSGPAILAMLPDEEIKSILGNKKFLRYTSFTPTQKQIWKKIDGIRRRGYAVSLKEKCLDTAGVAAPVFSCGAVVGSLAIIGPIERMKRFGVDRLGTLVKGVAGKLSDELDYLSSSSRQKRTERIKRIV
jgi:IclR family transcriptional regulator, acetate operon repressor